MNNTLKNFCQKGIYLSYFIFTKFVLEVLGAIGAIWGVSEVFYLRNEKTKNLWSYICMGIGVLFLIRYIVIIVILCKNMKFLNL